MKNDFLTDEQVEQEIERLSHSDNVRLARLEQRIKYKHRQALYQLRFLEKRGKELSAQGYTYENLEKEMFGIELDENGEEQ